MPYTRAIPKVSGLDILDNNIFHNLYISETYIIHEILQNTPFQNSAFRNLHSAKYTFPQCFLPFIWTEDKTAKLLFFFHNPNSKLNHNLHKPIFNPQPNSSLNFITLSLTPTLTLTYGCKIRPLNRNLPSVGMEDNIRNIL